MAQDSEELPRSTWRQVFESVTKDREGDEVTVEVLTLEFGDQYEAERLPFTYLDYDEHDDAVSVAVGGTSGRYPVELRHEIAHPASIFVDRSAPPALAIEVVGADGTQTVITLHPRAALTP